MSLSEDSPKKHPFPCPTTYRTALLHYVDIASVVKTHVLRELAEYAKDFEHKEFLMNITDTTEEAKVGSVGVGAGRGEGLQNYLNMQRILNTKNCL